MQSLKKEMNDLQAERQQERIVAEQQAKQMSSQIYYLEKVVKENKDD